MKISAQRIVIVDSLSGKPLPKALIQWNNGKTYTKLDGSFVYKKKYGQIQISYHGYKTRNLIPRQDTIRLAYSGEMLSEIIIHTKKKIKIIRPLKGNSSGIVLTPQNEFFILIKPKEALLNKKMVAFGFKISPLPLPFSTTVKKKEITVQFNIYENKDGKPGKKIYTSTPEKISIPRRGILEHKISKEIFLKEEGLFFSIKNLEPDRKLSEKSKNSPQNHNNLSIKTTTKKSPYFDAKSFYFIIWKSKNGTSKKFFKNISSFGPYKNKGNRNFSFMLKYL